MKFMMNGAVTIGTLDGANVEIHELVGDDNSFIFGLTAAEVNRYYENKSYSPTNIYLHDSRVHRVMDQLVNGFLVPDHEEFRDIFNELVYQRPGCQADEYFVLKDFAAYVIAQEEANQAYKDRERWLKMSLINIARSGKFSSDRTIQQYADEIWGVGPIQY